MPGSMRDALGRVDAAVYKVEQKIVGTFLVLMAGSVFIDVVHRVFSRSPGRLSVILGAMIDKSPESLDVIVTPVIVALVSFGVVYLAFRTRKPERGHAPMARKPALIRAVIATLVLTAIVQGFVQFAPQGVVWAPYFALSLFLWVGLVGASMATYASRHLALEMGEKLWPEKMRPGIKSLSRLVAGAFSLLLAVLGSMSLYDHFVLWTDTPQAALIPAVDIPKWIVFAVVPYAFLAVALRFIGYATGLLPTPPPEPEFELEEAR